MRPTSYTSRVRPRMGFVYTTIGRDVALDPALDAATRATPPTTSRAMETYSSDLSDGAEARLDAAATLREDTSIERGTVATNGRADGCGRPRARARAMRLTRVANDGEILSASRGAIDDETARELERRSREETRRARRRRDEALAHAETALERRESETAAMRARYERDLRALGSTLEREREAAAATRATAAEAETPRASSAAAETELETMRTIVRDVDGARREAERAWEKTRALEGELEGVKSALEVREADAGRLRGELEDAARRNAEQEVRVIAATRAAEALKVRVETAERRASNAETNSAMHSCDLVERAKREVADSRTRAEDLERRLSDATRALEDMREKIGPNMERARLEGAQTSRARIDAMSEQQKEFARELERKTRRIDELERAASTSSARFAELKRGAEFKIHSLEERNAEVEQRVADAESRIREVTEERDCAHARVRKLESILERTCSSDVAVTSYLSKLEKDVDYLYVRASKAEKLARARDKRQEARTETWRRRALSARRMRDDYKARSVRLVRANEESLVRITNVQVMLKNAATVIDETTQELANEYERRETAERATAAALERASTLGKRVDDLDKENKEILASAMEASVRAEERICDLTEKLELTRSELEFTRDELAAVRRDIDAATTREHALRWKNQEAQSLSERLARANEERDGVEATLAKREEELANAEARAARLDCELADAKVDARTAREEAIKASIELDRVKIALSESIEVKRTNVSASNVSEKSLRRAEPEETKEEPTSRALALTPDQVRPEKNQCTEPTEASEPDVVISIAPAPSPRGNPFVRLARRAVDEENADGRSPKASRPVRRPHVDAPLSPLSLLNVR